MKFSHLLTLLQLHHLRYIIFLSQEGASLYIKKGSEQFLVASLTKERPQASINIFITLTDEVELIVKGNGIIHAIGFYEPENEGLDGDFEDDLADLEEEEE